MGIEIGMIDILIEMKEDLGILLGIFLFLMAKEMLCHIPT